MSLEDLRDLYKNSGVPNDVRLSLNGATFRKLRASNAYKSMGNTIKMLDHNGMKELADLNAKYNLETSGQEYSLKKKKRWQMVDELKEIMPELAAQDENQDIRLFEKSNRNEKSSANCTAVTLTKQSRINVKKTYANFESIQNQMNQSSLGGPKVVNDSRYKKEQRKLQLKSAGTYDAKLASTYDKKRDTKKTKKVADEFAERIVINVDQEEGAAAGEAGRYAQYEVEYPPKKDVLKYGVDFAKADLVNKSKIKRDVDTSYLESYEEDDFSQSEEELEDRYNDVDDSNQINVDLEHLMNIQLMKLIDKKCEAATAKSSSTLSTKPVKPSKSHKDSKIYLIKSSSESHENYPVLIR